MKKTGASALIAVALFLGWLTGYLGSGSRAAAHGPPVAQARFGVDAGSPYLTVYDPGQNQGYVYLMESRGALQVLSCKWAFDIDVSPGEPITLRDCK